MNYVEEFVRTALKRFEAEKVGNSRVVNRCYDKIRKIASNLYKEDRIGELKPLMYHEHDAVRIEASINLLPFYTEEAEKVLEELSIKRGHLMYATADDTLKYWRAGKIKFSYYQK